MKKFKTFMYNLTYVQGFCLAFILSLISNGIFWISKGGIKLVYEQILLALIPFAMLTFLLFLILAVVFISPRKDEEEFNKKFTAAKKEVLAKFNLASESYTEVKFIFERLMRDVDEDLTDVILPLLNSSNFRFFAKLIDNEYGYIDAAIEVIVKDMNDNLIHTITISNFIYFQNNFEKLS